MHISVTKSFTYSAFQCIELSSVLHQPISLDYNPVNQRISVHSNLVHQHSSVDCSVGWVAPPSPMSAWWTSVCLTFTLVMIRHRQPRHLMVMTVDDGDAYKSSPWWRQIKKKKTDDELWWWSILSCLLCIGDDMLSPQSRHVMAIIIMISIINSHNHHNGHHQFHLEESWVIVMLVRITFTVIMASQTLEGWIIFNIQWIFLLGAVSFFSWWEALQPIYIILSIRLHPFCNSFLTVYYLLISRYNQQINSVLK